MKFIYRLALIVFLGIFGDCVYADEKNFQNLHLVYPQESVLKNPVRVRIQLKNNILQVFFTVSTPKIYAKKKLGPGQYPFYYDVVEIFLSAKNNKENLPLPYYEFELSPYNQSLQAKIILSASNEILNINTGIQHHTKIIAGGWTAEMLIPLKNLGWEGNPCEITGNVFAILGEKPRTFWSLYLPPESIAPNFHTLAYFKPLICSPNV